MHSRGFTLVELLVVIAIIGLLASIVLASLSTARNNSKDAAILSDLGQLTTMAELAYPDGTSASASTYDGLQTDSWVAGSDNVCAAAPFTSRVASYNAKALDICKSIIANTGTACGANCFYAGIQTSAFSYNKYYSFMAYLPGKSAQTGVATYACVGASGGRYIGPSASGWPGAGCYGNP